MSSTQSYFTAACKDNTHSPK